jgi:phosphoserine phosphatase
MNIRGLVIDFDGTIVTDDLLDLVCGFVGKKEESEEIRHQTFKNQPKSLDGLIRRINLLEGVHLDRLAQFVAEENFLRTGAIEFFEYCRNQSIYTIVSTGNILPLVQLYQKELGFDDIVASCPSIIENTLEPISESAFSSFQFKVEDSVRKFEELKIEPEHIIAIGDSPTDKGLFEYASRSIAINPQYGIEQYADRVILDDLSLAIPILEEWKSL